MSWFSSLETEFNYDFDVSLDEDVKPLSYNYMGEEATRERLGTGQELLGVSVFSMRDGKVFGVWEAGGNAGWHVSLSGSDTVREAGGDGNGD